MKIILAHPGQQHSYKVAKALKNNGMLLQFITSVYDKEDSFWMHFVRIIAGGNDRKKLINRKLDVLDDSDVTLYYTFLSLIVIVLSRFKFTKNFSYWLDRKISDYFGIKVAKYAIKNNADAVICFSMNEKACFEYLKTHAPQIKRIVDCANSPINYMKAIYENDMKLFKHRGLKVESPDFWEKDSLEKQGRGLLATEYFLAPSCFVKRGLVFSGVDEKKVTVIHYGTNFPISKPQIQIPQKLKFLYVGQVTYRKGMHHLLKVFSQINECELHVVGSYLYNTKLKEKYDTFNNIIFHGHLNHENVHKIMLESNVFVFNSLSEGLSLSCLEALSCGLPIICSYNSGVNDLITDGVNGFKFEYYDEDSLKKYILTFVKNPNIIIPMSKNAIVTAHNNTWDNYEKELKYGLKKIFKIIY